MKRGVAIVTYNRAYVLGELVEAVRTTTPDGTTICICDDGSTDDTPGTVAKIPGIVYIRGDNLGVGANKNRALFALQNCSTLCILEDDLIPQAKGWYEIYEEAALASGINHFCRVQNKFVEECVPEFQNYMKSKGFTPIYGPSPRGDLTFITHKVITKVGGFHPSFKGAGHAHGEWSGRVHRAELIGHPNVWVDIKEAGDMFIQKGDREGGRWNLTEEELRIQLKENRLTRKRLDRSGYSYHPLVLT